MVCTGNIARSPLAAALLRAEIRVRELSERVEVDSAGIHARPGNRAVSGSRRAAERLGVSLEDHAAQPVTDEMVALADLTLTMTERQRSYVIRERGGRSPRVFTLREFVRLAEAGPDGEVLASPGYVRGVARAAHERRPRSAPEHSPEDITDPFGGPEHAFREMAETLADLTEDVAAVVLGERRLF